MLTHSSVGFCQGCEPVSNAPASVPPQCWDYRPASWLAYLASYFKLIFPPCEKKYIEYILEGIYCVIAIFLAHVSLNFKQAMDKFILSLQTWLW